ncbi:hypothetical protein HF086_006972 [Spodoptera exigua]|uniref:Uncharacterized protein n=1 Tax=Spodoptera exigua TaxID=7107 RepID=A0A922MIJ3_SPOEX|nr:hypothetical protein HF086_006972 [Spodoptera exigua]
MFVVINLAPISKKLGSGSASKSGAGSFGKSSSGGLGKSSSAGFGKTSSSKVSSGKSSTSTPKLPSGLGSSSSGKTSSFFGASSSKNYGLSPLSTPKSNNSKPGFGIIWIPTKKHNKKKDVVYSGVNDSYPKRNYERSPTMYRIMSGDSPDYQPHKKKEEETDLLMPERTKAPIASIATAGTALATTDVTSDSTVTGNAEEKQEFIRHDKKDDSKEAAGDTNVNDAKSDKSDEYLDNDKVINKSEKIDKDTEKFVDKVDSVYLRPPPPHKARSAASTVEEEDCGIKCLYYTIQCCDCVLM